MFSYSPFKYIAAALLLAASSNTAFADDRPVTPSYEYDMAKSQLPTCFDYRKAMEVGKKACSAWHLFSSIRTEYETQSKLDWALKWSCNGGLTRELMTLTGVDAHDKWWPALDDMCRTALKTVSIDDVPKDTEWLDDFDVAEYLEGDGVLNKEIGNLQQTEYEFLRRGGYDRYYYIGEDPRLNDYFPTTEESYEGGVSIMTFYNSSMYDSFLDAPPGKFQTDQCDKTKAAMCCWSGDRQYNDNNGSCGLGNCAHGKPGDNTDLCWTETDSGDVFPYPNLSGQDTEQALHCHGMSWSTIEQEFGDVNRDAKWNNLYYISLYDHLYKRGYVNSVTDAEQFMGEQAMCGCVEDMNPVARADCTEAIGHANYTMAQNQDTGRLELVYTEGTFEIEYRACEGWQYKDGMTPETYQAADNVWKLGLTHQRNDLSAFVFKQFLEGKTVQSTVDEYEKTVIGYKHPKVNTNDNEREKVCKAAFLEKFSDKEWKRVVDEEEEEQ